MIPALLGLIAPVAAVKVLSGLVRAAGAALRSATAPAALPVPPVVEKAAEVSEQVSDSPVIFAYDGMSRRTKITEYTNGTVTSKKLYWWLGGSIACERDGLVSGFPITKRYFGQGLIQGTTKLFYTFDHLGSVRELVDDAGAVQAQYRYSTYGERTKETGNLDSDWGYAGLWHHAPSGLDLATYRLYDAKNRRWISRDPLGEGVDLNLYRYVNNSPVNLVDPEGLAPKKKKICKDINIILPPQSLQDFNKKSGSNLTNQDIIDTLSNTILLDTRLKKVKVTINAPTGPGRLSLPIQLDATNADILAQQSHAIHAARNPSRFPSLSNAPTSAERANAAASEALDAVDRAVSSRAQSGFPNQGGSMNDRIHDVLTQ